MHPTMSFDLARTEHQQTLAVAHAARRQIERAAHTATKESRRPPDTRRVLVVAFRPMAIRAY